MSLADPAHSQRGRVSPLARLTPRRRAYAAIAALLLIAVVVVPSLIHVPYAIFKPGTATNTLGDLSNGTPVIAAQGVRTYPTTGALDFMTVAVYGGPQYPVNLWEYIGARLDSHAAIYPENKVFPVGSSAQQVHQEDQAEMTGAQQDAIVVALRAVGKKVPESIVVADVDADSPAQGLLRVGDVIRSVDGHPATSFDAVQRAIRAVRPGARVTLRLSRGSQQATVHPRTREQSGHPVIGVLLREDFKIPVKVTVRAGDVGGPSAGLMFSLGIYDKLTPGALTGGVQWAGTGTISPQGAVGAIGGIQQKMVAARNAGATHFLAPAADCNEVVGHIPEGMTVVKVSTFAQAKSYVEQVGQGRSPKLPACS